MSKINNLYFPIKDEEIKKLKIGDLVSLTGIVVTARDQAHLRMKSILGNDNELPIDLEGGVIFHAGPVVEKSQDDYKLRVVGPTTSIRMEPYADMVGKLGVKAIIGKGGMGDQTLEACRKYGYVYLQAAPGCAVKLADGIKNIKEVIWEDLAMPEAMWVFEAKEFGPFVVAMDTNGNSLYKNLEIDARNVIDNLYER